MTTIPDISVQLVHIQGPLKGEIQEIADGEIRIGRHPDCQVNFPKDLTTLSRVHARIVREGNRFKLIDASTNGTYVNGQRISETFLKDGDVVMFSENGPKVSFLTQTNPSPQGPFQSPVTAPRPVSATSSPLKPPPSAQASPADRATFPPPMAPTPPARPVQPPPVAPPAAAETVKVPFAIQYGPALKSFHTLPIVIGNGPGCDFLIAHAAVRERHAQIFFTSNQYWIKDLTGAASITINGLPIAGQAALEAGMHIALTAQGPKFRFIGGGRLAQIDDPPPESAAMAPKLPSTAAPAKEPAESEGKKSGGLFKKFFT
jgi:pSer/pThr/pTyr-binding forkhead associated (FHA) protein